MYDKAGTMCLIDPQSHSCVINNYIFIIPIFITLQLGAFSFEACVLGWWATSD